MSRELTASVSSHMAQPVVGLTMLADVELVGGTLKLWSGVGYLQVGVNTYGGIGNLGGIEAIRESAEAFPRGLKMWLSFVDSSTIYEATNERMFNRNTTLYRCYVNSNNALVNTPEVWFKGRINDVSIVRNDPERGDFIECVLETRLKRELKASYYTEEDLWLTYSGDTFFRYTDQIPLFKSFWGQKPTWFGAILGPNRGGPSRRPQLL